MQPKDYYKILGVSETATDKELKSAFRKIAQESHPDRHPGDKAAEERFKEASEAYDILSDPEKRRKYDALRKYGFDRAGFGGGPGPGFGAQGFPGGIRVEFENLQDVDFADIFADNSPFASIFEQLFAQAGAGGGRGRSRVRFRNGGPFGGAHAGHRRAQAGAGTASKEHDFFRRDGLDAHCTIWLKLEQLEKGVKVKVRTPAGKKVLVTVPAKSRIGSVLRVPGMGYASGGQTGDQYVHLEAVA